MTVLQLPVAAAATSLPAASRQPLLPLARWTLRLRHWYLLRRGRCPLQAVRSDGVLIAVSAVSKAPLERSLLELNLNMERARL